jgi:hypothetical protein
MIGVSEQDDDDEELIESFVDADEDTPSAPAPTRQSCRSTANANSDLPVAEPRLLQSVA